VTRRGEVLAVACDGRADDEAGLSMGELAEAMAALGAIQAMNLDGGGSTSLVCGGRLRNVPREAHGVALPGGRTVPTALVFRRR
jgi:exopolysaccharide biosynthesis protein